MMVPLADLRRDHAPLDDELRAVFERVLASGAFVLGPEVTRFEQDFATWLGVPHAVAVQSGTAALTAALAAIGVGRGDEVVAPASTFVATVGAIHALGATPAIADVEPSSLTLDPGRVDAAISPRTRAIVAVHLYGQMAELDAIQTIADKHGIPVVEDAAQAHGAALRGRRAGTLGRVGCFSFYPGKNLGALGEGGAVVTHDPDIAFAVRRYRNHGGIARYEHVTPGTNARLDSLQAGFLSVKLRHLGRWNARRRACAARYDAGLAGLPLKLPRSLPEREHVYHLYVVRTPDRDRLAAFLHDRGIATGIHYPAPVHMLPAFSGRVRRAGDLGVSEAASREVLSLPMFGTLRDDEVEQVVTAIREFFARSGRA